jgi:flagellar motor switch protein FliN/FliY
MGNNELSQNDIDALFSTDAPSAPPAGETQTGGGTPVKTEASAKASAVSETAHKSGVSPSARKTGDNAAIAQSVEFPQLQKKDSGANEKGIDFLLDVPLLLAVELGRTNMFIKNVLNLGIGSVVELNKLAGEPVDLLVNNKLVARGEVVVINENFGVKIIDIVSPEQRIKNLS